MDLSGVNTALLNQSKETITDLSGSVVSVAAAAAVAAVPAMSGLTPLQSKLMQVILDMFKNTPKTKEEALAMYHTVSVQLGTCLVSDLPALEQKATLIALWAINEIGGAGCFSFLKR